MLSSTKRDISVAVLLFACAVIAVMLFLLFPQGEATSVNGYSADVYFSEICASNKSIVLGPTGEYSDYAELYNNGDTFSLNGFVLTDSPMREVKYVFGDIEFAAGSYLTVFLDGVSIPFALSANGGETLYLLTPEGEVVAYAEIKQCAGNQVQVREDDGYVLSDIPSPGFPNTQQGAADFKKGLLDTSGTLVINELLTENKSALPDKTGKYSDIIEIANISSAGVSTAGWYVSDDGESPHKYALPDITLAPGEILTVFCDGGAYYADGEIHASFGLSDGETAYLTNLSGKYTSVDVTPQGDNISLLRGDNGEYAAGTPSPGFENSATGIALFAESRTDTTAPIRITEVMLEDDGRPFGGKLADFIELTNVSSDSVSLDGWHISDNPLNPSKYPLTGITLAPGERTVLVADSLSAGGNSLNFSLSEGETLFLVTPQHKFCEPFEVVSAGSGLSWQRNDYDGDYVFEALAPSLGFDNTDAGRTSFVASVRPSGVEISELLAINTKLLAGSYATYHDLIELHNNGGSAISLAGMFISDSADNLFKAPLPDITLEAGGYVVFVCDTSDLNIPSGYKRLPINLSGSGETIYLTSGNEILDCAVMPATGADEAFGRPAGKDGFAVLTSFTPGKANNAEVSAVKSESPAALTAQGVYNDVSDVTVALSAAGEIRYTLDCSEPTRDSALYSSPIVLTKTTVIRAIAYESGHTASAVTDLIYVINEGHQLEVASIVTTPGNLWDYYTGIYADGPHGGPQSGDPWPYERSNYMMPWEKEATVSFFASDGSGFSLPCGIKIFGGCSRVLAMKSMSCNFRAKYGASSLQYKLFDNLDINEFENFIFRNSGQDFTKARMRDAVMTSLLADATDNVGVQAYRPVVLYLNGDFWGVYYIREKLNENYIAAHENVNASSVKLVFGNGSRTAEYQSMLSYAGSHDLSVTANYEEICKMMDVDSYIDIIAAHMCTAATDNGNIRYYYSTETDGKWRWIMYDMDYSYQYADFDAVRDHTDPNGTGSSNAFSTVLIRSLLKNNEFRNKFITRLAWQMNNIWTDEKVNARIDEIYSKIAFDMQRDAAKWGTADTAAQSYEKWQNAVQAIRDFQSKRYGYMYSHVKSYFSLSDSQMAEYGFEKR